MDAENKRKTRLQKLSGSDFEIAEGEPDIRGWDVKDSAGRQLGEVEELIFDYQSRKVRYLVIDLDKNDYDLDDRKVLVPIGIAELHEKEDDVILPGVIPSQLMSLPEYDEDRFDTAHEISIRNVFGGLGGAALTSTAENDDDFYSHDHFNEANLYRNRNRGMVDDGSGTILPGGGGSNQRNPAVSTGFNLRVRNSSSDQSDRIHLGDTKTNQDDYDDQDDINPGRYKRLDD